MRERRIPSQRISQQFIHAVAGEPVSTGAARVPHLRVAVHNFDLCCCFRQLLRQQRNSVEVGQLNQCCWQCRQHLLPQHEHAFEWLLVLLDNKGVSGHEWSVRYLHTSFATAVSSAVASSAVASSAAVSSAVASSAVASSAVASSAVAGNHGCLCIIRCYHHWIFNLDVWNSPSFSVQDGHRHGVQYLIFFDQHHECKCRIWASPSYIERDCRVYHHNDIEFGIAHHGAPHRRQRLGRSELFPVRRPHSVYFCFSSNADKRNHSTSFGRNIGSSKHRECKLPMHLLLRKFLHAFERRLFLRFVISWLLAGHLQLAVSNDVSRCRSKRLCVCSIYFVNIQHRRNRVNIFCK